MVSTTNGHNIDVQLLGTLDSNSTLSHVDLRENPVEDHLLAEIEAITVPRQSQAGQDRGNASGGSLLDVIRRVRSNDPQLRELELDNRPSSDLREMEAIVNALAANTSVSFLSMCNSNVDDSLIAALSLVLAENTSVEEILLSDNQITSEGCEYVSGDCLDPFSFLTIFMKAHQSLPMTKQSAARSR